MSGLFRRSTLLVFAVVMVFSRPSVAGLQEGLEALKKGDYVTASKELRPVAERGDAEAQYRLGLMYEFGKGFAVALPFSIRAQADQVARRRLMRIAGLSTRFVQSWCALVPLRRRPRRRKRQT
jgi:hypothetical protein